jgi:hypothetical protein
MLNINFIHIGSMEIYCIFKTCYTISLLFPTNSFILSFFVFHKLCTQNTHLGRITLKLTLVIKQLSFPKTQKKLLQKDVQIWADIHSNAESITDTMSTNVMGTSSVPVKGKGKGKGKAIPLQAWTGP